MFTHQADVRAHPVSPDQRCSYRAPPWLMGGHAQTLFASCLLPLGRPPYERETWRTTDADDIVVDCIRGKKEAPVVVLFHGLDGSSGEHYAKAFAWHCLKRGWSLVIPHFRRCGHGDGMRAYRGMNRNRIDWTVGQVAHRHRGKALFAAGVSFGGNALLKWLADSRAPHAGSIRAAAVASVPLDLRATVRRFFQGVGTAYRWYLSRSLRTHGAPRAVTDPELLCRMIMAGRERPADLDELLAAPLPGYQSVRHFLDQTSALHDLPRVQTPTLIINARNDPCLGETCYPEADALPGCLQTEYPRQGGHVGFVTGTFPGRFEWLPDRAAQFFDAVAPDHASPPHRQDLWNASEI